MPDFTAFKTQLLDHYVAMSSQPFAKAAAWHTVNELAQKHPSEFSDLPALLTEKMKGREGDASV